MGANLDDLFRLAQKWAPQSVGIEVSGQQAGYIPWIQSQMSSRNIWFTLASDGNSSKPGIRPTTAKLVRFNTVVPLFKAKKMFFPREKKGDPALSEGLNELSLASRGGFRSKADDFIDTISMLSALNAWRPSEEAPMSLNEDDLWELDTVDEPSNQLNSYVV